MLKFSFCRTVSRMGVDPGGMGDASPFEKMWGITYTPPPSSRPTTGSWGGACNDTERCNRAGPPHHSPPPKKNTKFVVITWVLSSSECTKTRFRPGLRPGPRWGSLRRSPEPLVGWGGGHHPIHSPPPRRLRRLVLAATPILLKEIYANGITLRSPYGMSRPSVCLSVVFDVVAPYPQC